MLRDRYQGSLGVHAAPQPGSEKIRPILSVGGGVLGIEEGMTAGKVVDRLVATTALASVALSTWHWWASIGLKPNA